MAANWGKARIEALERSAAGCTLPSAGDLREVLARLKAEVAEQKEARAAARKQTAAAARAAKAREREAEAGRRDEAIAAYLQSHVGATRAEVAAAAGCKVYRVSQSAAWKSRKRQKTSSGVAGQGVAGPGGARRGWDGQGEAGTGKVGQGKAAGADLEEKARAWLEGTSAGLVRAALLAEHLGCPVGQVYKLAAWREWKGSWSRWQEEESNRREEARAAGVEAGGLGDFFESLGQSPGWEGRGDLRQTWKAAGSMPGDVCWEVLGVPRYAEPEVLKAAYRRLCWRHHPDRGGEAEAFQRVRTAYECAKARYDLLPRVGGMTQQPAATPAAGR
jgi:DnaJ-domain-containing protein 1